MLRDGVYELLLHAIFIIFIEVIWSEINENFKPISRVYMEYVV